MPISTVIKRHLCPPKVLGTASSINWWFANTPLKGAVTGQLRIEDGTVSSKETPKSNLFSLDLLMHENSNAGKERKKAKGNSRGLYNLGATVSSLSPWCCSNPALPSSQLLSVSSQVQAYVSHRKIPVLALQTDIMMAIWVKFGYKPCLTVCIVSSRIGSPTNAFVSG